MYRRFLFLMATSLVLASCQFTETLVLNEDGSGRMSVSMDLSEMMAFSGEMPDSTFTKQDTIIAFKDILEAKKDSIAQLPKAEQKKLKAMENYKMRMFTDPETQQMIMDIFVDFEDISEANDLMEGFQQAEGYIPGANNSAEGDNKEKEPQIIGVSYSYAKGTFKRDAYILDEALHKSQLDSLKQAESFMGGIHYKIKYTFPKKIKSTTVEDATFSLDGKTMEFERRFLDYFKDPDVLDVVVELED